MGWRPSTQLDVKSGDAVDAWSSDIALDFQSRILTVECWNNNLNIRLSNDGGTTYSDPFEVDVGRPLVIPFSASVIQVQNKTPGAVARYQAGAND